MPSETRFEFGQNWARFLRELNEERVLAAEHSLCYMLGVSDLEGKRFLDIGCGSGLFSLAARRLGATVHSFDYDRHSVQCAHEIRHRYSPGDPCWTVQQGDVLDEEYVRSLGQYDIVYSWGVLHHTGQLWRALENATLGLSPGATLFIALYNDQGWISRYWRIVKRLYNRSAILRWLIVGIHSPFLVALRRVARFFRGKGPLPRGMSLVTDMFDWLGGYPYEVSTPEQLERFGRSHRLTLVRKVTCGRRSGCNEFVFRMA